jgi:exonuclease III
MSFNYLESVNIPLDPDPAQKEKNKTNPIRRDLAVTLIKDYSPDILGFQEPHLGDLEFFQSKLKNFAWIGKPIIPLSKQNPLKVAVTLGKAGTDYNAIFYNKNKLKILDQGTFWLNETMKPGEPSKWGEPRKYKHIRACTWAKFEFKNTKKSFWVFNTHLSLEHIVINEELKLIAKIIEQKIGNDPVFFIGDLNMQRPETVFTKEKGYINSYTIDPKNRPSIDNILVKNIPKDSIKNYEVIDYYPKYYPNGIAPSDHSPIYADVSL